MTDETGDFTYKAFLTFLDVALKDGFMFAMIGDKPTADRVVYLRHDIDNSISAARRMAEVEADRGVSSTYFVMLRSPNYNPATYAAVTSLTAICELGHK